MHISMLRSGAKLVSKFGPPFLCYFFHRNILFIYALYMPKIFHKYAKIFRYILLHFTTEKQHKLIDYIVKNSVTQYLNFILSALNIIVAKHDRCLFVVVQRALLLVRKSAVIHAEQALARSTGCHDQRHVARDGVPYRQTHAVLAPEGPQLAVGGVCLCEGQVLL